MNQETTMDYEITDGAREYKAGLPAGDAQDVYDAMMRTFEHFKSENDDRLKAIEKRGGDVIAEEKVARIDAALNAHQQRLDELSLKGARPALSAEHAVRLHGAKERKSAFDAYIRSGESAGLRQIETKAMSVGSSPDGGYLVPEETETEIGNG
jgi:HK97 family phage major capsid protein